MSAEQNASFYTTENSQQLRKIQTSHAKAYKNKPNKNKQVANSITVFIKHHSFHNKFICIASL